ncbi:MAG: YggS family pyridoxal phosphate-dependent enzyme [Candidatus Eiseniibacteriota bacterium]|nr:MAG: YggS family pyridoxal phosphate-dependent enzyme [Candidatus Eisenbacteria bacterium]
MATLELRSRLDRLLERVAAAAARAGRDASEITIVAVVKTVPVRLIEEAIDAGITHVGENRVQEAFQKFAEIGPRVTWHMVGHLQRNKVNRALEIFNVIQSVDSLRLAGAISERAVTTRRVVDVLLEVNTSGEETKYGFAPDELCEAAEEIDRLEGLRTRGLMTVGPFVADPEEARHSFVLLRNLRDRVSTLGLANVEMRELSMGMTNDFEVAVEEGATMIRVGTAIFGERQ